MACGFLNGVAAVWFPLDSFLLESIPARSRIAVERVLMSAKVPAGKQPSTFERVELHQELHVATFPIAESR